MPGAQRVFNKMKWEMLMVIFKYFLKFFDTLSFQSAFNPPSTQT